MWTVAANTPSQEALELVSIRKKLRLKQREMADALGVGFDRYRNMEYRHPTKEALDAARFMLAKDQPIGLLGLRPTATGKLRVLGSVGAGPGPEYARDDWEMYVPVEFSRDDYGGLTVPPDATSMLPTIHPGDTLIFKVQPVPKLNKILAVRLPGDTYPVVKKCVYKDGKLTLRSLNPEFPDLAIDGGEVLGYLVGIISVDYTIRIGPEDSGIDERFVEDHMRSRLA